MAAKTPTESSIASEPISEDSAMDHLGHRRRVEDDRWKIALEKIEQETEPCGGSTSHHLNNRNRRFGKRHFDAEKYPWVGFHRARSFIDPGGEDAFENKKGSFLGSQKKKIWGNKFQGDDAFGDEVDPRVEGKRMFYDKIEAAAHATEDIPIGVSSQIDLHTRGFLGASKRTFGGMMQVSSDPVMDMSSESADVNDLSSYGLNHRGKRKFLVQSNLESGCRHNLERLEGQSGTRVTRSASVPVLDRERPANETPYWQDSLPDGERAQKKELPLCCAASSGHELDREMKPRKAKNLEDNTWSCLAWTPRKVDEMTAARFIEGQDAIHERTDQEHREEEFRNTLGKSKRNYGNAHNKSIFRFDYNDDPGHQMEHYVIVNQHLAMDQEDDKRLTERALMWGKGHGRKKFGIKDHLDKDDDGVECYQSASGAVLGKVKHKRVEDHLDRNAGVTLDFRGKPMTFMTTEGIPSAYLPRNRKDVKDNIDELMNCEVKSEDSNTLGVAGTRRKNEIIRPHSARRFPQKDFEKKTPRSVTPRPTSDARTPLSERPRWAR